MFFKSPKQNLNEEMKHVPISPSLLLSPDVTVFFLCSSFLSSIAAKQTKPKSKSKSKRKHHTFYSTELRSFFSFSSLLFSSPSLLFSKLEQKISYQS